MMIQNKHEEYVIALYIRLSKEDEDVGIRYGKEESNSISNQRMLIYDFIRQHSEFQGCRIIEKCDDGFSGKRFDRPAFTELIDLARFVLSQLMIIMTVRMAVRRRQDWRSPLRILSMIYTAETLPKRSVMSEGRWHSPDSLQVQMRRMVIRSLQRTSISWWLMKRRHRLFGRSFR